MTRFKNILFLAVLLLSGWLIGQRLWTIHVERNAKGAAAEQKANEAARLEPCLVTIHAWQPKPEQKCDDAAPQDAPWFVYSATGADGSVIEALSRAPAAIGDAERLVALREDKGNTTVIVLDAANGQARCWTTVPGPAPARVRAEQATRRIAPWLQLRD